VSYTPRHLAERILAEQAALEARGAPDGERKTITALFADMAGFTALTKDLDPEDARYIIDPALKLMMDAVHRYEGYVAQSLGDGIFALFGAPIAHEDHPQRALYAALLMQDEMRRYADRIRLEKGVPLQIRVGVNTGEVVLRSIRKDDLHTDYVPVGHSTNLASRMEGLALPGSIVVSDNTYKLIEGYFECKALGEAQVKGIEHPVNIYEVLGVGSLRTRLQVAARQGLARFVGRRSELEQMQRAFEQAKVGHGQIVAVMGEPGVGKSRLFHEFKLLAQKGCLLLETFSVSYGQAYPYLPLIDLLMHYFQIDPRDDERQRREKITGKVLTLDRSLEETLSYLFFLLGAAELTSPLQQMDPQVRRQRTFDALKRLFLQESLTQPLLLVFEDLHWLDTETQAFLLALSENIAASRILLLVSYRPEYQHPWSSKTYYTQLRLDPLGRAEAEEFLGALVEKKVGMTHASPLRQFILDKTEGNPFFMEEIVQTLVEQKAFDVGVGRAAPLPTDIQLPPTIQGVLAARIDRLSPEEKALLQTLAVVGKEFSFGLLKAVADQPEDELQRLLSRLRDAEFIYEQPAFPEPEYVFKHALTQEVAYNSLLVERRKAIHEKTAQAIEALFHDRLEDRAEELAYHYSCSGNIQKTVEYLQTAGQHAVQRSAYTEAIKHFTTAVGALQNLPDTPERVQRELTLQLTLAASLQIVKGPSTPEVERAYTRAHVLCQQGGEARQHFSVLRGLWVLHHVRANLATARELGEQLVEMAERVQDSAFLLEAHRALGSTLLWQGEFALARVHLERAVTFYDPQQHHSLKLLYGGADSGVSCHCEAARVLWFLGYAEQALQQSQAALTLAYNLSDPFSLGFALIFAAGLHQLRREGQAAQDRAEEGIRLASAHGFAPLVSAGTSRRGWALAEQGQTEEGLRQMRQGLAARQMTGAGLAQPYFLALQAEVYGKAGQREQALALLAEALAAVQRGEERRWDAELHRLKGELTLQKGARDWRLETSPPSSQAPSLKPPDPSGVAQEAEECFLKAIELARKQQAKSLELRATTSLARLWRQQGKQHEARNTLAEIYDWFTEGFDTKDLQEAKALLDSLAFSV
jgi:class 3 adenylate cyclase/predicted ATPase